MHLGSVRATVRDEQLPFNSVQICCPLFIYLQIFPSNRRKEVFKKTKDVYVHFYTEDCKHEIRFPSHRVQLLCLCS